MLFKVPGGEGDDDRTVAALLYGDCFEIKEIVKMSVRTEQEVNRVTIPVPRDAFPAKYVSRSLFAIQLSLMKQKAPDLKQQLASHMEVSRSVCTELHAL